MSSTTLVPFPNWISSFGHHGFTLQKITSEESWISRRTERLHNNSTNDIFTAKECLVLEFKEFIPWNNPANIVSFDVENTVRTLKDVVFMPILFLIGFPANIINMAVFYRQGLKERINVCLFALSLADGLNLAFNMILYGEQLHLIFTTKEMYGPVTQFITNLNLWGFYGFVWISQVMSAIIASERCFCVLQPLRSQTVLKTSTMTAIIVSVYIGLMVVVFLIATRFRVGCAFDPVSGLVLMTIVPSDFYLRHQQFIDYLDSFIVGGALPGLVVVVVVVATTITIVKLGQAASWRAVTSSGTKELTQRDFALNKMLVANSLFFTACVLPLCISRLVFFAMPEMNAYRRHHNFYLTVLWLNTIISYVNSSFNIVVYYSMGSRYRQTFWQLFGGTRSTK